MSSPTICWYYDATEETAGTRSYANQESGTATTFSSQYTIYNKDGTADASNCSIYLADVQGSHVSDQNVAISFGTTDTTWMATNTTIAFDGLSAGGTTNASTVVLYEIIRVETDDVVGTREWSKNITYQYS